MTHHSADSRKGVTIKNPARGRQLTQRQPVAHPSDSIDTLATLRHYLIHGKTEIQYKREQAKVDMFIFFILDSSGSMMRDQQIAFIKGLVAATVQKYKTRRIRYAAVALCNGGAQLLSAPTLHADDLLTAVSALKTGGKTNLQAGFALLRRQLKANMYNKTQLYIFTDGKINAGSTPTPFEEAVQYYKQYLSPVKETTVVNTESGFIQLHQAQKLARAINAVHYQDMSVYNLPAKGQAHR
ncbi:vWA domain-containing protein [Chitinophaga rhizophila]|uniref:VWA domain-containing protein n=1 Tax=Chitinophaga rhizophila TaxID=2866212 RepID=A0ABS7GK09_9BACT|nr:VWA domain-containing protein [Chitinophaga rhizophila]MBW8687089.1 VWA domain-containing protein [Chitinophaga rhizophila]